MTPLLTKSKYLNGLQCPKLLWTVFNGSLPEVDAATQYLFDQGHLINGFSRQWFPDGVLLSEDDFMGNVEKTKEALKLRKPLFEPGFLVDDLYARADILVPVGDQWDLIEVKSSTEVKDVHIQDVAFQKFVYQKAGLRIRNCSVMIINNQYVKDGDIDPKQLLKVEDVTVLVDTDGMQARIDDMFRVISSGRPDTPIGPQCNDPYDCALIDDCWAFLPDFSVTDLYYLGKKKWDLISQGILSIADVPDGYLNDKQKIQKAAVVSGSAHVDKGGIGEFLSSLEYPLYYLDFETVNPAVPLWDGCHPYQQVPFQFSLHIQHEDGRLEHFEYLHSGVDDPRPAFLETLKPLLGTAGTILAFNQSFEIGRLRECSEAFPSYKPWYDEILPRFVDLITPFRSFLYHSPEQHGSNSIKAVLPAMTGQSYDNLTIADGGQASRAYLHMTFTNIPDEEKQKIRKDLLKYCGLDTEGMVWVVERLRKF